MIISNLTGGLGNQMFQYSVGRNLSIKNSSVFKLHFTNALFATQRSFSLDHFAIKAPIATTKDLQRLGVSDNRFLNRGSYLLEQRLGLKINRHVVTERRQTFDPEILKLRGDLYLQGYWQSPKYFTAISDQIRKDFVFKKEMDSTNRRLVNRIKKSNAVSIHIRRGDYITDSSVKKTFTSMSLSYYKRALSLIEKRIKKPEYFVFSDDIGWARANIQSKNPVTIVDHNSGPLAYEDMRLISLCKHNIISNSTFSWWGAWLNNNKGKIIIAPSRWSETELGKDLVLKDWIKI